MFPLATSVTWVFLGWFVAIASEKEFVAHLVTRWWPMSHHRPCAGPPMDCARPLDSVGAFLGPLLAVLLMGWFANDIRTVLWFGVVPAVIAVARRRRVRARA